ncbi:serine hydrolase [Pseudonocardia sp. TMWB2A]|uniref:serine hydrolase domain-containing protein n=1 Tax=Pseudonocardia sp. TMWB2A TaxID=687430 RepID=UPI00307DE96B
MTTINSAAIDGVLKAGVDGGSVPHVAAIVADRDGVIYEGGFGPRVAGESGDVSTSTHFRIMSMTKMVATTAALQQRERGDLDFDAPVENFVPEFANVQVLDGFDGDTPKLRAPKTKATVKHLLTHTSGLAYWFWDKNIGRFEQVTGTPNVVPGDMAAFGAPMVHDPGERFTYGINTDWLGRVVEAVAGQTLDVVVKENITGPLGMNDTMFALGDAHQGNKTPVHVPGEGGWASAGNVLPDNPQWWAGGHGLHSTPRDYVRFTQMLLRNGELGGERILTSETVDEAFTNQIGNLDFPHAIPSADPAIVGSPFDLGPGWKWGWGLLLNTTDVPGGRKQGTGAWAGLFNTHFWVDRTTGITASIYTNSLPFITPGALGLYADYEQAVYAAL